MSDFHRISVTLKDPFGSLVCQVVFHDPEPGGLGEYLRDLHDGEKVVMFPLVPNHALRHRLEIKLDDPT